MLAFSIDYYGIFFGATQSVELFCTYVDKGIPAVLLLGDMFKGKDTVDNVIINWFQKGETIENFFAWLNEYGNQNNVYVPICIDAINEVDDNSYWNSNLPLIIAKAEAYSNIKIIVSCRSIYLEEYLDEEKIGGMLQVPHSGFDEMEVEALGSFCEYYGVNINYDTTCVPEFMNPLFLKMLCEIAIGKEDKTVVVEDIQTLMGEFFDVKNKIISKYYAEYFSVKDKVVSLALSAVTQYMAEHDRYSMTWFELRTVIAMVLAEFGIQEKTAGFIKLLISENLLREADEKGAEITFAYQKFYEYLYAQKYLDVEVEIIVEAVENKKITLGTLEMIQILFLRNTKEKAFREVWMQVRTYLYTRDKKNDLLKWFEKKDFEGRWMPEGYGQLYECCIGEYPWSPTMVNYLGQEEEQDFRQENPAPCYLITTANDYTAEKDSPFCTNEESSYMFPSKFLMEQMNLTWDGSFGYAANGSTVIVNGQNNALFIKKKFLLEFIEENELDVVWTVLGEKQKITGGFGRDFPGRAEFSYTYYINEKEEVSRNHKVYNIMEAGRY